MPAISRARAANVTTDAWTKLYTEIMSVYECRLCMASYLKLDPSTTVHIKFVPSVSGLPSSVEAQTSATGASTSVVFTPGPRRCTLTAALQWPSHASSFTHDIDFCEIFECAHLKFMVCGRSKHRYTHASAMQSR